MSNNPFETGLDDNPFSEAETYNPFADNSKVKLGKFDSFFFSQFFVLLLFYLIPIELRNEDFYSSGSSSEKPASLLSPQNSFTDCM